MEQVEPFLVMIGIIVIAIMMTAFILLFGFRMLDTLYVSWFKRPLWVHFYITKKRLTVSQRAILKEQFSFYNKLTELNKKRFEHRVASFLEEKEFIERDGIVLDDKKKVMLAATAIMLTFGMRDYLIPIVDRIIVYPDVFYSKINNQNHKGEFNPLLRALVFSWKDFEEGFRIEDDNLNLGIHEFTHAIHVNSLKSSDASSVIFADGFHDLEHLLLDDSVKSKIMNSTFFREYAFTNKFEFLAVVLENFIESPEDFKLQFPVIYKKIRQMFNFRFAGY